jgi:hypothetical protein
MNFKSIIKKTIAIGAFATVVVNCHPDKIEDDPLLFALAAQTVTGLGKGNCAISLNGTAFFYGNVEQTIINSSASALLGGTDAAWVAHYNSVNGTSVTGTTLTLEPYNKKYDTFYTDQGSWNSTTRAALLNTLAAAAPGALGVLKNAIGSAILACGRIPKTSCSVAGLSTASQAKDIENAIAVSNLISNTPACRRANSTTETAIKNTIFRGLTTAVTTVDGVFTPSTSTFGSFLSFSSADQNSTAGAGNYSHLEGNSILASNAYPKVGALVSLGFGALMPVREGSTPYSISSTSYTAGSNISATSVDSCEILGLPGKGFTSTGTNDLTSVKEVVYAFSQQGAAAAAYASAVGANAITSEIGAANNKPIAGIASPTASNAQKVNDAIACNSAMRDKVSIPLAVGGGKLDEINAVSGDGFNSRLLVACLYGNNSTARGNLRTALTTADDTGAPATLSGIIDCPANAVAGAAKFGDTGLTNLSNFPND